MSTALVTDLTIFVLALLIGNEWTGTVPATLHTPLISAVNSIHGIVLVGAMLIGVTAHTAVGYVLAFVAAFFAAANVVGGYAVTGRMLKMFRRRGGAGGEKTTLFGPPHRATPPGGGAPRSPPRSPADGRRTGGRRQRARLGPAGTAVGGTGHGHLHHQHP